MLLKLKHRREHDRLPGRAGLLRGRGLREEEEEDLEAVSLPEELSVPLLGPENPWSSCARFNRDFILVAEFSEQVGPSPVLTIPDDPRVTGSFDLNHFSVRIMSVDYQASGPGPTPPSCPGPRLNFSEDSRVVLGDSAEDAFAYVHHVTLLDLEARGMVRPFCMAYVCSDQAKLMENFSELSSAFSKASDSLKTGNRQAFSAELQRKLHELEFKRLSLKQETVLSPENGLSSGEPSELETLELSILHHRELLRQVTSYPNRKLQQPDFLPYDPADSLPDSSLFLPSDPCEPRPQHQLKSLAELCNPYFLTLVKEQLADTEARLRGDRSLLRTSAVLGSLSKGLALTHFLFELWASDDAEEEEDEEEKGNVKVAPDAERPSLESFFSCVEELPIKMEVERRRTATPDPTVFMEMTGSVSSSDSIEVLGTEKSFRTQQSVSSTDGKEPPGQWVEPSAKRTPVDAGVRRVRAYARRANSEDSIEVLSTTDSICPEDLSAITEEPTETAPCPTGRSLRPSLTDHRLQRSNCPTLSLTPVPSPSLTSVPSPSLAPLSLVQSLQATSLSAVTRWSQGSSTPARLLSVDERSDCTSATGSSDPPTPATLSSPSSSCCSRGLRRRFRKRRKAGLRALRFLKQHSFCQHALFCLLSGGPWKVVDGLSLFVPAPGPDERAVMPSVSEPLQLTDLLAWRLVGVHRCSGSAFALVLASLSHFSRYVSVLDLDQRTLKAPSYSGSLIGRLADAQCGFSRGLTYLLHLESELSSLQNQALLYALCPPYRERPLLTPCDRTVLHYLSDLMAQRHAGRGPPVLGFSYCHMQLHKNTAPTAP
ncbi:hypothetical protein WMY93_005396 [Mugilogobius chulae]|uniref:UDENN FLCN/SMCR8-type domain-containing protein n=1 Tax=Mugilogobius chulae TaxID=88201 RepID=A0AAW0PJN7_9GOBI